MEAATVPDFQWKQWVKPPKSSANLPSAVAEDWAKLFRQKFSQLYRYANLSYQILLSPLRMQGRGLTPRCQTVISKATCFDMHSHFCACGLRRSSAVSGRARTPTLSTARTAHMVATRAYIAASTCLGRSHSRIAGSGPTQSRICVSVWGHRLDISKEPEAFRWHVPVVLPFSAE
jgi:hypothetical protein